ncbi:MAG: 23S rRNA (adenine(2503)-C(2))-methyltransferase RlmN [Candidatus Coprenecus sp.]
MKKLLGMTLEELKQVCSELGTPAYTAKQIAHWLYVARVDSFDKMTNLSKALRERLSGEYEIGRTRYVDFAASQDGTKKYLFPVHRGDSLYGVEAVMIPDKERATLCVSSQPGCRMGCRFCMTGRQGYHGSLDAGEIINQYLEADESARLTNTVFMGMGEPLDNWENVKKVIEILVAPWGFGWSPKRITLSTIGINRAMDGGVAPLRRFLDETSCHLAVSLHNPFPAQRAELMPMEKPYPIEETISIIKEYDFTGQRRVSFEYIMFNGVNDSKAHADALARLLKGLECRINLIRFHKIPDSPLETSPMPVIEAFKKRLNDSGIVTTLRASRGEDILAACGMLSGKQNRI